MSVSELLQFFFYTNHYPFIPLLTIIKIRSNLILTLMHYTVLELWPLKIYKVSKLLVSWY